MQFAKYVKTRYEKFGAVVFDTLTEKVYITNDSGKAILAMMADGLSASEIAERLSRQYEEDASEMLKDVDEFVDGLQSAGLLATLAQEKS